MSEQLRVRGAPSVRQQLRLAERQARVCRQHLAAVAVQDRRGWEAVDDVLTSVIALCERSRRCSAEEAIAIVDLIEELMLFAGLDD